MKNSPIPFFSLPENRLGLGCGSLGSRIPKSRGLKSLFEAYDHGITWYDVAPAYGSGNAETILGEFARGRREKIQICTKVGVTSTKSTKFLRLLYPLVRPIAANTRNIRKLAKRSISNNIRNHISAELLETTVAQSLSKLGTDYLDVLALHEPYPEDVHKEEVLRCLEDMKIRGMVRAISVAGDLEAAERALEIGTFYDLIQIAADPGGKYLPSIKQRIPQTMSIVTHSVLGLNSELTLLCKLINEGAIDMQHAQDILGGVVEKKDLAATLLVRSALSANPSGITLMSMFSRDHLYRNIGLASLPTSQRICDFVRDALMKGD